MFIKIVQTLKQKFKDWFSIEDKPLDDQFPVAVRIGIIIWALLWGIVYFIDKQDTTKQNTIKQDTIIKINSNNQVLIFECKPINK